MPADGPRGIRRTSGISGEFWWFTNNKQEAERLKAKLVARGINARLQTDSGAGGVVYGSVASAGKDYYVKVSAPEVTKFIESLFL